MKQSSLIINIILALGLAVLYVLHFSGSEKASTENMEETEIVQESNVVEGGEVYFVNVDSVFANSDMYFDLMTKLQNKLKTSEAKFQNRQKAFQKSAQDFQYKAEKGLITRSEGAELQQNLLQEEQELMRLQNSLQMELAEEEQVAQRKTLNSIEEYLAKKQSEFGYSYVLGTTVGGGNILYGSAGLNITQKVIADLNAEYKASLTTE